MKPRITILWSTISGYLAASLTALAERAVVTLCLSNDQVDTKFEEGLLSDLDIGLIGTKDLRAQSRPDILIVGGWRNQHYLKYAYALKGRAIRVLAMDNQWRGGQRQISFAWAARKSGDNFFDYAWVPGERQVRLARQLGFGQGQILEGLYTCDWRLFSGDRHRAPDPNLLFVGRLVPEKALESLIQAWEDCRADMGSEWKLQIAGDGPLRSILEGVPGVESIGFLQPRALADTMKRSWALVLPSQYDAWGVVIHEAVSAGLPVIASRGVGAADYFVDNRNGWIFERDDILGLSSAIDHAVSLTPTAWSGMSKASVNRGKELTPDIWARRCLSLLEMRQ